MFNKVDYDSYFEKLFWEKRFFIQSIVRKYIKNPDKVDDIVQQTFLKIYLNIKKIHSVENPDGYLHSITVNETMDYFRKFRQMPEISMSEVFEQILPDRHVNTEKDFLDNSTIETFGKTITSLPAKRRAVVSLRIFEDKSFSDISQLLGMSEVSARNLFSIAMKGIRKKLTGQGG